ncbi:hypothetical protein LPJ79_003290 [Coemansia sp. RSA 1821]|nr:hypothetical protein LPJ79_003290 [Coemansia sp. RSA 1821]
MEATRDLAIAHYIAAALKTLPAGHTFAIRVIYTEDSPVESLTPQRQHKHFTAENTLSRRVLILVSQNDCFVAGLEAQEFTTLRLEIGDSRIPEQTIGVNACISKVDTTGEHARMPLVRMLVAGYLASLHRYSLALDIVSVGIHLFARAQPEYLFANSKHNPSKRTLDDSKLIAWWQRTLQFGLTYAMEHSSESTCITDKTVAYCVVPGGEQQCIKDDSAVEWKWGLPHPPEATAHNCVLQFPDDPITRLLAEPHTRPWSVSMLLEMLAIGEECGSGHRTAFFSAALPIAPASLKDAPKFDETAVQGTLSFADYDKMLVVLFGHNMDFSTSKLAAESSKTMMEYLRSINVSSTQVKTGGLAITTEKPPAVAPVNDLSSIVRKKRKTS